jgi:hypothetical protein
MDLIRSRIMRIKEPEKSMCNICFEEKEELFKLDCQHGDYNVCKQCLKSYLTKELRPACLCLKNHPFETTREMYMALDQETRITVERFSERTSVVHCPSCKNRVHTGVLAKVYTCSTMGCVNPPYGYCVMCHKGIQQLPHECSTEDERKEFQLTLEFLRENGVCPCPACNSAVTKLDETDCNHMTCRCGAKFCAACGMQFLLQTRRGELSFLHDCKSMRRAKGLRKGNYIDRDVVRERISEIYGQSSIS